MSVHWRAAAFAGLAGALGSLVVAGCGAPPQERPPVRLRFASDSRGAAFSPLGRELAREYERALPGIQVELADNGQAEGDVEAIHRGQADIGLTYADVAYLAYVGRLDGRHEPLTRLRGIAMLQLSRLHVVVRGDLPIQRIEDLRGLHVRIGRLARGTSSTVRMVLGALGIGLDDVAVEAIQPEEAAARLAGGTLDVLFINGAAPVDVVVGATRRGARLLAVDGPSIARLRRDYPFFSPAVIPGDTYPGHPAGIRTVGVDSLLVCRADLPESLVHDLTQRLFEILPLLSSPQLSLAQMDLRQAPATPIPLHEGAARYYRERELLR